MYVDQSIWRTWSNQLALARLRAWMTDRDAQRAAAELWLADGKGQGERLQLKRAGGRLACSARRDAAHLCPAHTVSTRPCCGGPTPGRLASRLSPSAAGSATSSKQPAGERRLLLPASVLPSPPFPRAGAGTDAAAAAAGVVRGAGGVKGIRSAPALWSLGGSPSPRMAAHGGSVSGGGGGGGGGDGGSGGGGGAGGDASPSLGALLTTFYTSSIDATTRAAIQVGLPVAGGARGGRGGGGGVCTGVGGWLGRGLGLWRRSPPSLR